jgi:GrpB-like predicted nucleotidyltransferase (UPF0157 family)
MSDMAVYLVEHDPQWTVRFAEQRDRLTGLLAPWLAGEIEHVGSTAVPGLRAKPIVDILATVTSLDEPDAMVEVLTADGWLGWPDDPTPARLWFLRPEPAARTHHLQIMAAGDARVTALLAFRDALRADPALAAEYAALKDRLAAANPTDREAYTDAKADFVAAAVQRASLSDRNRSAPG